MFARDYRGQESRETMEETGTIQEIKAGTRRWQGGWEEAVRFCISRSLSIW